jgi:GNAT superfamily N-acetyltransferase
MKIRLGERKDASVVAGYLKEMWLMHCDMEPEYVSKKIIGGYSPERIKRYLKDCFNKSGKSYLLIAEENNELVGFLKADVVKIQRFFVENRVLFLDDGYVKKEYRRRGISKALQAEAEKIARKRKIKWIKGRIYEFNKPVQGLAESVGMRPLYSEYFKILK